jgi:Mor family transcriptional regulator
MGWRNNYHRAMERAQKRRAAIKALRSEGMAIADIAQRYRISRQRVEQILKAAQ